VPNYSKLLRDDMIAVWLFWICQKLFASFFWERTVRRRQYT